MSEGKRLRRSPEGGYARGDETRRKIIEAALALFGRHGFEGASTREIAARAGVNAPALQYYFENKEGLYRACAEWIADESWQKFEPAVLRARAVLATDAGTEALIDAFIDILMSVADRTFVKHHEPDLRLFFAREQSGAEPEIASTILQERIRGPLNQINVTLLERITGTPAQDPITVVRMFSLYGQFLLFHLARRSTLAMLGWQDIDAKNAEFLKSSIAEQTRMLLQFWNRQNADRKRSG